MTSLTVPGSGSAESFEVTQIPVGDERKCASSPLTCQQAAGVVSGLVFRVAVEVRGFGSIWLRRPIVTLSVARSGRRGFCNVPVSAFRLGFLRYG